MASESLEVDDMDELTQLFQQGKLDFFSCPPGMMNHVACHGLMPKKTADGSRHIRFTREPDSALYDDDEPEAKERKRRKNDPHPFMLSTSHDPGPFRNLFCEFDHGVFDFAPRRVDQRRSTTSYFARMNLAQLDFMGEECAFCSVLAQAVRRWKWIWGGPMNKYRYSDKVWECRHLFPDGSVSKVFDAADRGEYDERFYPGPMLDEEVALYISFARGKRTLEIVVQKYPHPDLERMMSLMTLEFFVELGNVFFSHRNMLIRLIRVGTTSPWPVVRPLPSVSQNLLSPSAVAKLQARIDECLNEHQFCRIQSHVPSVPPTRLIEIRTSDEGNVSVRLLETDLNKSYKYVALSHSWASSKPLKTGEHNYHQHKDDIPWQDLSQVYQETITMADALSIEYVWIDSLCIIQQSAEEWDREAHRMGEVYTNAFIVFVALGGDLGLERDAIESFDIHGTDPDTGEQIDYGTINVRRKCEHENLINSANDKSAGEWFRRGWCFQERLFSSRLLHFGGALEDVTFECNTHLKCECGGAEEVVRSHDKNTELSSLWCHVKSAFTKEFRAITTIPARDMVEESITRVRDQLFCMYIALCEDFSSKRFTFSDDTLPAMDSLATKLGPYMGNYHAGLWEHNILVGLQWESFDATRSRRYSPCCAPSFSWASCTGGSVWYFHPKTLLETIDKHELAEVVSVKTVPVDPLIPYGKVKSSTITIRGLAKPTTIERQETDDVGRMCLGGEGSEEWVQLDTMDDIDELQDAEEDEVRVMCLELMRSWSRDGRGKERVLVSAIVLRAQSVEENTFRRIGFAILSRDLFDEGAIYGDFGIV
jgi:hypothetical protein